jgi:hypothetical protein
MNCSCNQNSPLARAKAKLYSITGGSEESGDVRAAKLTTAQRIEYFKSPEFRDWVASEKACGKQVFWLKDVDKTQGAGDVFTFFFEWRAKNNKFSAQQLRIIGKFLLSKRHFLARPFIRVASAVANLSNRLLGTAVPQSLQLTPAAVLRGWKSHELGGDGFGLMDFWGKCYWPSQTGLTKEEKLAQVREFAPTYAEKAYPGVAEENRVLTEAGVEVVIVSNGDQELAIAIAPVLDVLPENVVGSHLMYDDEGLSMGENHTYEVYDEDWAVRPQPGKFLSFHYWLHMNRKRFGWNRINDSKTVIAGRDGDSGSTDGGMMIFMAPCAIGNFMVNTPGEPGRIERFYKLVDKYGGTPGQYFTLNHQPSKTGALPED